LFAVRHDAPFLLLPDCLPARKQAQFSLSATIDGCPIFVALPDFWHFSLIRPKNIPALTGISVSGICVRVHRTLKLPGFDHAGREQE